jgi:hypothetical protein
VTTRKVVRRPRTSLPPGHVRIKGTGDTFAADGTPEEVGRKIAEHLQEHLTPDEAREVLQQVRAKLDAEKGGARTRPHRWART